MAATNFDITAAPLKKIAQGNQYRIYANGKLVVKAQRRLNQKISRFAFPLDLPTASYRAAENISERVLPFEIRSSHACRIAYLGAIPIKRVFRDVIVQERVPEEALLDQKMVNHVKLGDLRGLEGLFRSILHFSEELICRGLFLPDPVPSNFCVHNGELKLLDCGMLQTDREEVLKVLTNSSVYHDYIEQVPAVLGFYFYTLAKANDLSSNRFEKDLAVLGSFKSGLMELARPEKVADLWDTA